MRRILLVGVAGCWSSSPAQPQPAASAAAQPERGGEYSGGVTVPVEQASAKRGGSGSRGPTVSLGTPTVSDEKMLGKDIIRRYISRHRGKLESCYIDGLLINHSITGIVTVQFTIGADGRVTNATASGGDVDLAACMRGVIENIEFPNPIPSGSVIVEYPFVLHPLGATPP